MEDIHSDSRFAHIVSDPKFRLMPTSKRKVKIDSRFESMFSNKHFSHKTSLDKRGRPVLNLSKRDKHVMQRFYQLSDEDDDDAPEDPDVDKQVTTRKKKPSSSKNKVSDSLQKTDKHKPSMNECEDVRNKSCSQNMSRQQKLALQVSNNQAQDDDNNGESDGEEDELPEFTQEFVIEETGIDHKWNELHADASAVLNSTRRLAVCNMDWDFVKAQDLYILFKSFIPSDGHIKSVTVYPSEFGKERMAEEARLGPREIRGHSQSESQPFPELMEEMKKKKKKRKNNPDQQQVKRCSKEVEATQTEKLREYQLNRLRYYFAVVDCDSATTADNIYNECDGREYLLSSVRLDLRFIPDDMTFDDEPKEMFSEDQRVLDYQPHKFTSTALSQAKVDVTWDETDFDRLSRSVARLQHKELEAIVEENKYADIIAPPESDSEEDEDGHPEWLEDAMEENKEDGEKLLTEQEKISVYRRLLMAKLEEDEKKDKDGELDQEYVWQPGLKSAAVKKVQKKEKRQAEAGVVHEFLERRREKKRKKRMMKKTADETDEHVLDDDGVMMVESKGQKGAEDSSLRKRKKLSESGEDMAEDRAELELLVMGSSASRKQDGAATTKLRRKKKSKQKNWKEDDEEFVLDVNDQRFNALYTSHLFHIDPHSSQYKKTKNMNALVNEQIKRRAKQSIFDAQSHKMNTAKSKSHLLIESLKYKIKK